MGLTVALNNALSGLNVNQQALTVLSQNIANANTPGYSRETLNQQAVYVQGQGEGVNIESVTRTVDDYLVKAVQQQNATVGSTGVISDYNTQIQQLLGQPGSNNSMDTYVTDFFNSLQSLAQTPSNTTLQQTAVNSGITLSQQMNQLATGLQTLQLQADNDIGSSVTQVNNDLKSLQQLNTTIANNTALGQSTAGLEDQRDTLLNDVSQYIPIQTYTRANGSINISTTSGVALLSDNLYQLSYTGVNSPSTFANNGTLSPIIVQAQDDNGNSIGSPTTLVPGGPAASIVSPISGGKIAGLMNVRDQEIPGIMSQLDELAGTLRDQVNAVQNSGTGYPGANSYTGERLVNANDYSQWTGAVRIAVLGQNGSAIPSPYADEPAGQTPLTLDLSGMNTSQGQGNPSTQDIINYINQYYGTPQNKVEVGNLNNVQLVSDTKTLPSSPPTLNFDFNLQNISATSSNFYVTGVSVKDSGGVTLATPTSTIPSVALDPVNTYVTTANSGVVTVNTTGLNNNLTNGEVVFLSTPPGAVDGIANTDLGGYFTISGVTPTSFQITATGGATATIGMTTGVPTMTAAPPYSGVAAGVTARTNDNGQFTADLSGNPASAYYTVTVTVGVDDGSGNIKTSNITYRVNNNQSNMLNMPFAALSATGNGTVVAPTSSAQPIAIAMLVDANGNPLPTVNGQYTAAEDGYLEIKAGNSNNVVAIDSLNSAQQGKPNTNPAVAGTNLGFSSYFGLNNFFTSNNLTLTGDSISGSAINLQVEKRLQTTPSLMSLGSLVQSSSPNGPVYTYERDISDNSVIQKLGALGAASVQFTAAGGIAATQTGFSGYAGQIIGAASTNASTATTNNTNANTLLSGYTQQSSTISGVNLDSELANTVIYQNAYTASARVITVANTLFDALLSTFTGG